MGMHAWEGLSDSIDYALPHASSHITQISRLCPSSAPFWHGREAPAEASRGTAMLVDVRSATSRHAREPPDPACSE